MVSIDPSSNQGLASLYPDNLLDVEREHPCEHSWWVCYTKARQEKAFARDLFSFQVPHYLPLVKQTKVYGRRRIHTLLPVFTGYVFVSGTEENRVEALETNRLSKVLTVHEPSKLVRDLRQLQQLILSGAPLTLESRLTPGARVRVRHGALAGLEGTVLVRRSKTRLLISVNFMQQGASVAIEDYLLEPIG